MLKKSEEITMINAVIREYYERIAMTHVAQLGQFGWCMCKDSEAHISEGCLVEKK